MTGCQTGSVTAGEGEVWVGGQIREGGCVGCLEWGGRGQQGRVSIGQHAEYITPSLQGCPEVCC